MKEILQTRLMHWKKQSVHLLFWLAFPIIATILVITITSAIQDETKVPVGIVLEENTPTTEELYEAIKTNPLIRVYELSESEAINQLNKHELDSVFVIKNGYESKINRGTRNRLITGYYSNLSFAYMPVKEMVLSYVQQDAARSKAIFEINQLSEQYADQQLWSSDEIAAKSKQIESEQQLLHTNFSFIHNELGDSENEFSLLKTWNIWALFTLLSTFLLFDWSIKERNSSIKPRFSFMRVTFKNYLIKNFLLYLGLLFLFDIIAIFSFSYFLNEPITFTIFGVVLSYRLLICLGAFLLTLILNNLFLFYSSSFLMTLVITIGSGALVPIDGLIQRYPWLELLNPLHTFLSMQYMSWWLFIFIILIIGWYIRKEKNHA